MLRYLLKRLTVMFPTLAVVVVIGFSLNQCAPGDPVRQYLGISEDGSNSEKERLTDDGYSATRKLLGLDKPIFYFNINSLAQSDTLYRIDDKNVRECLAAITKTYGNWEQIQTYYVALKALRNAFFRVEFPSQFFDLKLELRDLVSQQIQENDLNWVNGQLDTMGLRIQANPELLVTVVPAFEKVRIALQEVQEKSSTWKTWIPSMHWYGTDNQFHNWLGNALKFDFGKSFSNRQSVSGRILDRLPWTILLSSISFFFAFLISVPLGVYSARRRGTSIDKGISLGLFLLYSLPAFWVGILLMSYFANPEHFAWFPPTGIRSIEHSDNWGFFKRFLDIAHHLVMPTLVYTYGAFTMITRHLRSSMLHTFEEDFIRTAFSKGLAERRVAWHHVFRNSLSPIITLTANILPGLVGGSIIIESIFAIPGMGSLLIDSVYAKDYPTLSAIFLLTGVLTVLGILLSDILLLLSDPRIKLARK